MVIEHTIEVFEKNDNIDEIILVVIPNYYNFVKEILLKNNYKKVKNILNGGDTRQESSYIAINSIIYKEANLIIHDSVRPFLSQNIINNCIKALDKYNAVDVCIPCTDTIIETNNQNIITNIPNRNFLRRGQTPQCFKLSLIKKAHNLAKDKKDMSFTDDCGLILKYKLSDIHIIEGENENIKITYPIDIDVADKIFQIKNTSFNEEKEENVSLNSLKDKVIVIFGGTSGIGKSIDELANKYKAKVYSTSLSKGCDIIDYKSIVNYLGNVYKANKQIDYIINTAGILKIGKLVDRDIEDIKKEVEINYIGSINVSKASISYLKKSNGCLLLFTSSSYTKGRSLYSIYSSSKAAVSNLIQGLAEELEYDNIRVNAINPSRTLTPMREKAFGKENKDTLLNPDYVAEISLKVLLSNLTGQIINIRSNSPLS